MSSKATASDKASNGCDTSYLLDESTEASLNVLNNGEFFHPLIKPSEIPLNVEYLVEHVDKKKTIWGDGPCITFTINNEKRNLFISKYFASPPRYDRLYMLANKEKSSLMFKIIRLETRDNMIVPTYEFSVFKNK